MESEAAAAAGEVWCGGAGSVSALTPGSSIPICYHSSFGPHDDLLLLEVQHVASRRPTRGLPAIVAVLLLLSAADSQPEVRCSRSCVAEKCDTIGIRYGKYCGVGWTGCPGEKPCDELDDCCKHHDECIEKKELEENCLEQLVIQFQRNLSTEKITEISENGKRNFKNSHSHNGNESYRNVVRSTSGHPLFSLTRANFWSRNDQLQPCSTAATRNGDDELSVFIAAAILIINHQKIFREAHSMDDVIKIFNDNMLKINVKRCISMAIKLRKKYFYKE